MGKPCKTVRNELLFQAVHTCTPWTNSILWRKTEQNELFLQAVHTCTPWRNSILWRQTVQMSL